jgi:hypothetical protein
MYRLYATLCAFLLLSFGASASAQISNQKLAEINRVAMEAYNNLDIETAKTMLEEAVKNAERAGTHGAAMARTYSNYGVVVVGGMGDSQTGIDAFTKALREDPNVEPDPIVATPEIMVAYATAKKKAGSGRASSNPANEAVTIPSSGSVEGNLRHEPAAEQLSQTALPIFVSKAGLKASSVKIFYRSLGMSKPKSAQMTETTDGWTYLIPCADVFEPSVEYFIVAEDDDGDQVGNAGTPERPVAIPVVSTRTQQAPSLPGQAPPQQCGTPGTVEECPPGLPGCSTGRAQLGDTCRSNSDCASGLSCLDDFCAMGESEDSPRKRDKGGAPRWFLDVGAGAGFVYVGQGKTADRPPPVAFVQSAYATQIMMNSVEAGREELANRGWTCDWNMKQTGGMVATNCKVTVKTPGMIAVPMLNIAAGYFVTPKLGIGLMARIQLDSGEGILAGTVIGARLEYLLTQPKLKGLHAGVVLGVGVGSIQAKPPSEGKMEKPYASSSSPNNVGLGVTVNVRLGYRFNRYIGLQVFPGVSVGIPNVLIGLDVTGGLAISY